MYLGIWISLDVARPAAGTAAAPAALAVAFYYREVGRAGP
jgi:hypothetical protein